MPNSLENRTGIGHNSTAALAEMGLVMKGVYTPISLEVLRGYEPLGKRHVRASITIEKTVDGEQRQCEVNFPARLVLQSGVDGQFTVIRPTHRGARVLEAFGALTRPRSRRGRIAYREQVNFIRR